MTFRQNNGMFAGNDYRKVQVCNFVPVPVPFVLYFSTSNYYKIAKIIENLDELRLRRSTKTAILMQYI